MWGVEKSYHLKRGNTYRCNVYRGWIVVWNLIQICNILFPYTYTKLMSVFYIVIYFYFIPIPDNITLCTK